MKQWLTRGNRGYYLWICHYPPTFEFGGEWGVEQGVDINNLHSLSMHEQFRPDLKLPKGKRGICELKKIKGKLERVKR